MLPGSAGGGETQPRAANIAIGATNRSTASGAAGTGRGDADGESRQRGGVDGIADETAAVTVCGCPTRSLRVWGSCASWVMVMIGDGSRPAQGTEASILAVDSALLTSTASVSTHEDRYEQTNKPLPRSTQRSGSCATVSQIQADTPYTRST